MFKHANLSIKETHFSRTTLSILLFAVMIFGPTGSLVNSSLYLKAYGQEQSFLEICDNFADDDGDGFADSEDPEGCSPNEGEEAPSDQGIPPQDIITYPDGRYL